MIIPSKVLCSSIQGVFDDNDNDDDDDVDMIEKVPGSCWTLTPSSKDRLQVAVCGLRL